MSKANESQSEPSCPINRDGACPDDQALTDLAFQRLPTDQEQTLERVLNDCSHCQDRLARLVSLDASTQVGVTHDQPTTQTSSHLAHAIENLKADSSAVGSFDDAPESLQQILPNIFEPVDDPEVLGRLGKYDLLEVIGRGGMGVVVKAIDRSLDRVVAIKFLLPEYVLGVSARERFIREAKAAASIHHPNVVTVYAVEQQDVVTYLVMECVEGDTLADRITEGGLSNDQVQRIAVDVLHGLKAAHHQHLVHRDIKPSNVLIHRETGVAKLSDFGLVKAIDDDSALTVSGTIAGTPEFMSPEQASSQLPLDARSDLFSVGVLLYTAFAGVSPFRAGSTIATLRRVCDEQPEPLATVAPHVPSWFCHIIDRLLKKLPAARFQTADEVLDAINQQVNLPNEVSDASTGKRQSKPWVMAAIGLLLLIAVPAGWWISRGGASSTDTSTEPTPRVSTTSLQRPEMTSPGYYLDDGSYFETLAAAILSADQNATIWIHGDLSTNLANFPPLTKPLTIRAAPGSLPMLDFPVSGTLPAIVTNHALRLQGIQFQCDDESNMSMSLNRCLITTGGAELEVINCGFQNSGWFPCLGIDGPATIQNCQFDCGEGAAVFLSPTRDTTCVIDNCHFQGRLAIAISADAQLEVPSKLQLSGCWFQTSGAMRVINTQVTTPFLEIAADHNDFEIETSLFGRSNNMQGMTDLNLAIQGTTKAFPWVRDEHNRFASGKPFLLLERRRGRGRTYQVDSRREWLATWQLESNSTVGFDGRDPSARQPDVIGPGESYQRWLEQTVDQ